MRRRGRWALRRRGCGRDGLDRRGRRRDHLGRRRNRCMRRPLGDLEPPRVLIVQQQHRAQDRDQGHSHQAQAHEQPHDDLSGALAVLLEKLILGHGACSSRYQNFPHPALMHA